MIRQLDDRTFVSGQIAPDEVAGLAEHERRTRYVVNFNITLAFKVNAQFTASACRPTTAILCRFARWTSPQSALNLSARPMREENGR